MLQVFTTNNRTFEIVEHSGNATPTGRTDRYQVYERVATPAKFEGSNARFVEAHTYTVAKLSKCRYSKKFDTVAITGCGYSKVDSLKETVIALVNKGEL